jgi:hypothetical protein
VFHNLVVKMLYATKWARLNTCTATGFLMMRVWALDKQGWLEQTGSPNEISQRHAHTAADP